MNGLYQVLHCYKTMKVNILSFLFTIFIRFAFQIFAFMQHNVYYHDLINLINRKKIVLIIELVVTFSNVNVVLLKSKENNHV
jgi:uncharacterized protein with PQ loop repeat